MRIGLLEMWEFITNYHGGQNLGTLLESCGVSDLIATCYGGRNRRVSEAMVLTGKVGGAREGWAGQGRGCVARTNGCQGMTAVASFPGLPASIGGPVNEAGKPGNECCV